MGLLSSLAGRTDVLTYEIYFDDQDKVSVKIDPKITPIKQECIRLFASYFAKIIFNFQGPYSPASQILLELIRRIIKSPFDESTDVFDAANMSGIISYAENPGSNIITTLSGSFSAWRRNGKRTIDTKFPLSVTEQQVIYSVMAIFQKAINENRGHHEYLLLLRELATV
ncbi:MAG: hypothetical protein EPN88_16685, partial [Bacteroidetes bacterium]